MWPRGVAIVLVVVAGACATGGERAPTTTTTVVAATGPGLHDHTPHHGGVVGMTGTRHLEAVLVDPRTVRVYLTDFWRQPLPVAGVSGTVTFELPEGDRTLALRAAGDAL